MPFRRPLWTPTHAALYSGTPPPALPTRVGFAKGVSAASNSTSYSVTLPSGITAGNLLVAAISCDGNPTLSDGSGLWTKLGQLSVTTIQTVGIFYKIAAGSDTLTITSSAAEQFSHMAWEVSNADSIDGTGLASAGAGSANADPPSHTPAGGTKDYLWIAFLGLDVTTVPSAGPSGYSNFDTQTGTAAGASCGAAERSTNASSEDPGAFTHAADQFVVYTLGIWKA